MSRPRSFDHAAARLLRASGWSYPRIAAALGVDQSSVQYACKLALRLRKSRRAKGLAA